jgi:hypothetical protein
LSPDWTLAVSGARLGLAVRGKPGIALDLPRGAPLPQALGQALSAATALGTLKGARVRLVLDAAHIAVTLTEPVEAILSDAEQRELARHALRSSFGTETAEGEVRHASQGPGLPLVAAGMSAGLGEALREALASSGARLVSIAPYLGAALDRARRMLPRHGWAAVVEPDGVSLLRLDQGLTRLVPQPRGGGLADAFHRLALSTGAPPGPVALHNAFEPLPAEPERDGWSWHALPVAGRGLDPALAMAANI